jgi:transposase
VSKSFRTCDLDQPFLLPPSLQDWLPENHLARFIAELMPGLDLSKIYGHYGRRDGRGKAAYHPVMMVRLLLYGYCVGVTSSRRMEHASYDDIAFRYLCADQHPDHDTIADFRQQHLPVLAQLFTQVLQLCDKAGLVKLGHVAIDGTKLQANASKHKAMSYNVSFRRRCVTTVGDPISSGNRWRGFDARMFGRYRDAGRSRLC